MDLRNQYRDLRNIIALQDQHFLITTTRLMFLKSEIIKNAGFEVSLVKQEII